MTHNQFIVTVCVACIVLAALIAGVTAMAGMFGW